MKHVDASAQSRCLAYFLDYMIVGFISEFILGSIIYPIINLDPSLLETKLNAFIESVYSGVIDYEVVNQIMILCFTIIGLTLAVTIPLVIIYFCIIPMFWDKQTIGRMACGLKVVRVSDEGKVGFGWLLVREVIGGYFLTYLFGGSLVIPIVITIYCSINKGRSLADYIGNTRLINVKINTVENSFVVNDSRNSYSSSNYVDASYNEVDKDKKEEQYSSDDDYMVI